MAETRDIPILEQHSFLDHAKQFEWAEVKRRVSANPALASVQPCGRDGTLRWSALHQAAFGGCADAVCFLLRSNAAPDAETNDGKTPLDVAKTEDVRAILRKFVVDPVQTDLRKMPTLPSKRPAAVKAMMVAKTGKSIRAMKVMKAKRSKIAKGKRGKALVYRGRFERTAGGLKKEQLTKSKAGKIVSKRMQTHGQIKGYANIKGWVEALMKARAELGLSGFVAVKKGSVLYAKTKELYLL